VQILKKVKGRNPCVTQTNEVPGQCPHQQKRLKGRLLFVDRQLNTEAMWLWCFNNKRTTLSVYEDLKNTV